MRKEPAIVASCQHTPPSTLKPCSHFQATVGLPPDRDSQPTKRAIHPSIQARLPRKTKPTPRPTAGARPHFSFIATTYEKKTGGDTGYRRSAWGVAATPSNSNTGGGGGGVTDTPGGYGTDEGYFNDGGRGGRNRSRGRRESRASYRSRESSGWGLTSDDGGDYREEQQRRRYL